MIEPGSIRWGSRSIGGAAASSSSSLSSDPDASGRTVIALLASPANVSRSLCADVFGGGEEATSEATMPPRMLPIEIGLALVVVAAPPEAPATVAWEEGSACADEVAFDDALTHRLGTKPEGREWVEADARVAAIASESGVR